MNSASLIADYIIYKGKGALTPLQIIKLAYISHGFTLALLKRPLISNRIEAWKYGPVIPAIYHLLKHNGGSLVSELQYCGTKLNNSNISKRLEFLEKAIDEECRQIIDKVFASYGHLTAMQLSCLTHDKNTPWSECYQKTKLHTEIPNNVIQRHYEMIINTGH